MKLIILLLTLIIQHEIYGQNKKNDKAQFPIPSGNPYQLFYLQRTENTNTVIYELNYNNGELESKNPIHIFWILYAQNGQRESLSEIEKKFVYGINIHQSVEDKYEFSLIAYPKIIMQLMKDNNNQYHVYVNLSKNRMILNRAYIKTKEGGSKLKPDIEYLELTGINTLTNQELIERISIE